MWASKGSELGFPGVEFSSKDKSDLSPTHCCSTECISLNHSTTARTLLFNLTRPLKSVVSRGLAFLSVLENQQVKVNHTAIALL